MIELQQGSLWTDYQPMTFLGTPIGRRCAVARTAEGGLVVFSPLQATPEALARLKALGRIVAFVVPSRFHDRFFEGYFAHFPEAVFLGNAAAMNDHRAWPLRDLRSHAGLLSGIQILELAGMPGLQEHVFLHEASKTLIVADALFNVPREKDSGALIRLLRFGAGIGDSPGLCRLFRTMVADRTALAASMEIVLSWDFDRILPGHGQVIETRGRDVLRHAFRRYLTPAEPV